MFKKENKVWVNCQEWLKSEHMGKFVLIKNDEILGIFDTFGEAVTYSLNHLGQIEIFIKKVV